MLRRAGRRTGRHRHLPAQAPYQRTGASKSHFQVPVCRQPTQQQVTAKASVVFVLPMEGETAGPRGGRQAEVRETSNVAPCRAAVRQPSHRRGPTKSREGCLLRRQASLYSRRGRSVQAPGQSPRDGLRGPRRSGGPSSIGPARAGGGSPAGPWAGLGRNADRCRGQSGGVAGRTSMPTMTERFIAGPGPGSEVRRPGRWSSGGRGSSSIRAWTRDWRGPGPRGSTPWPPGGACRRRRRPWRGTR